MNDNNRLILPQLTGRFSFALPQNEVVIVAGGRAPDCGWLKACSLKRSLWCADKGVEACRRAELAPQLLLGDMDSASHAAWQWAKAQGCRTELFARDKDRTDLQLVLEAAGKLPGGATAIVSGAFGGRFDHIWANAAALIGSSAFGISGWVMADEKEVLLLLPGPASFCVEAWQEPEVISLLPLAGPCCGVKLEGAHWTLPEPLLRAEDFTAISNRPQKGCLPRISLEEGWLGVYFAWDACQV